MATHVELLSPDCYSAVVYDQKKPRGRVTVRKIEFDGFTWSSPYKLKPLTAPAAASQVRQRLRSGWSILYSGMRPTR